MTFDDAPVVPEFRVAVPDRELDELRRRLHATRWPADVHGEGWAAGMPGHTLRELVADWAAFDWRAAEQRLNQLPHVTVDVGGYPVHAVHRPGVGPDPLPIVASHGWPSTFAEWQRVIGPLTDPAAHGGDPADAFTVVAPSLPGYVFSPAPRTPGTPALTDSPAGLAAWVGEKWFAWSDQDDTGAPMVPREDLLTALSLYWFTGSIGSASRLYYESVRDPVRLGEGQRVQVPCGFLLERPGDRRPAERTGFAAEQRIGAPPRARAERAFTVARWTEAPVGGHFPALETPELFVDEVRAFFRPLR